MALGWLYQKWVGGLKSKSICASVSW